MVQRLGVDAKMFRNEWLRHHKGCQPIRWMLRESGLPWVRFHALPGSKRYAENEAECETALFRANVLGNRLLGAGTPCWLVEARTEEAQGVGSYAGEYVEDCLDPPTWRFYVQPVEWQRGIFDVMLTAIANDEAWPTLWMNRNSGAIFSPYDGGFDLFPHSHGEVESLKAEWADWLSLRPDGL
jgi:hypothetical protein